MAYKNQGKEGEMRKHPETLSFRVTTVERRLIEALAAEQDLLLGAFIRGVVMEKVRRDFGSDLRLLSTGTRPALRTPRAPAGAPVTTLPGRCPRPEA